MTVSAEAIMNKLRPLVNATVKAYHDDFNVHDFRSFRQSASGTRFIWSCRPCGTHLFKFDGPGWIDRERRQAAALVMHCIGLRDGGCGWHEILLHSPTSATLHPMTEASVAELMTQIEKTGRDPRREIKGGDRVAVTTTNGGYAIYRVPGRWSPDAAIQQFVTDDGHLVEIEHERLEAVNLV